jgi:hypothetical protein
MCIAQYQYDQSMLRVCSDQKMPLACALLWKPARFNVCACRATESGYSIDRGI